MTIVSSIGDEQWQAGKYLLLMRTTKGFCSMPILAQEFPNQRKLAKILQFQRDDPAAAEGSRLHQRPHDRLRIQSPRRRRLRAAPLQPRQADDARRARSKALGDHGCWESSETTVIGTAGTVGAAGTAGTVRRVLRGGRVRRRCGVRPAGALRIWGSLLDFDALFHPDFATADDCAEALRLAKRCTVGLMHLKHSQQRRIKETRPRRP